MSDHSVDDFAAAFSKFINGASNEDILKLAQRMTEDHRTLQQRTMLLFLECVSFWAIDEENGYYDLRNDFTCQVSKNIRDALSAEAENPPTVWHDKGDRPFVPFI